MGFFDFFESKNKKWKQEKKTDFSSLADLSGYSFEDESENEESTIVLQGSDGKDYEFMLLDFMQLNGRQFAVFLPVDDVQSGEVVILEVFIDGDECQYSDVDDLTAKKVFEKFKKDNIDKFDFED